MLKAWIEVQAVFIQNMSKHLFYLLLMVLRSWMGINYQYLSTTRIQLAARFPVTEFHLLMPFADNIPTVHIYNWSLCFFILQCIGEYLGERRALAAFISMGRRWITRIRGRNIKVYRTCAGDYTCDELHLRWLLQMNNSCTVAQAATAILYCNILKWKYHYDVGSNHGSWQHVYCIISF